MSKKSIRDELITAFHNEGAFCGECDFEDGFDGEGCEACGNILGRYADKAIELLGRPNR